MAAQGRYQDALALIKKENPLPAICGRICNRRCEDACTRGSIDEAIARMEQSCTECAEYGMKFMLMRDTILLRHAKILLKLSKKTKPEEVRQ